MNDLRGEVGIDMKRDWNPLGGKEPADREYPQIYAIQGFIAFEYECHHDEVGALYGEVEKAKKLARSQGARRALAILADVAQRQLGETRGISFKP